MTQLNKHSKKIIPALKAAFPLTIPVLTGYLFLGMGFGILLGSQDKGYGLFWTLLMSLIIFAGSMQYAAVGILAAQASLVQTAIMTLLINARHLFYGLSMIEKYKDTGKKKLYLIFGLTDETYSLLSSYKVPDGIEKGWFYFFVTLLNHCYWIAGCCIGNLIGTNVSFNSDGIEFVMTALFVVLFIDQWMQAKNHLPALTGLLAAVGCLLLFGADNFIIPAMLIILVLLSIFRKPIESEKQSHGF